MTFDARERSTEAGAPVEIYTFARDYLKWRYTSSDRDVTVATQLFSAVAIERGPVGIANEMNKSQLAITVARDNQVADLYRISPPSDPITLIIQQYHEGDADLAAVWTGRVLSCEWGDNSKATLRCEPVFTSLRRTGLRRAIQRACPHVLYEPGTCNASKDEFRVLGHADDIQGFTLSVTAAAAWPDGYFGGGYVEWEIAVGIYDRRFITAHTGGLVTLATNPFSLALNQALNLYPGCEHTMADCSGTFHNEGNYGGLPWIPIKNPFGGNSVF